MSNILKLAKSDVQHLLANVVSCIITIGLIVIPSLFAWYNVLACWDVFDNTGDLKVAVANSDDGYKSDLIPIQVNIGDMVVAELRGNNQIDWQFVDESEAIDGAKGGRYYAAVVIPAEFSQDMLTFYSGDMKHAQIVYYANEKKNPISPKVTTVGADAISSEVNQVFAKTLSEIALSLAQSISSYAEDTGAAGRIGELANHIDGVADTMDQTASVLGLYSELLIASQAMSEDCAQLASTSATFIDEMRRTADNGLETISSLSDTICASANLISSALEDASEAFEQASHKVDEAFDTTTASATQAAADLRSQAAALGKVKDDCNKAADVLEEMAAAAVDPTQKAALESAAADMRQSAAAAEEMQGVLNQAANALEEGIAESDALRDEAKQLATEAQMGIDALRTEFDSSIRPALEELASKADALAGTLAGNIGSLDGISDQLIDGSSSIGSTLDAAANRISASMASLQQSASDMRGVAESIRQALASGDANSLRTILTDNASSLAAALSAPVGIERHALYESPNFGSSMAPFYSTLAVFIGSLLIMVAIKPTVSSRAIGKLEDPKPRELFLGRFGVIALISLAQTTVMALGNILFLQVKAENPLLLILCFWTCGLVFAFLIYSLVYSFANLGKAIAVVLLIMQITGCGGSYPLQILPGFVQALSPWLPATHAVNAMRAAMFGIYQGDFWIQMGALALFIIPAAILGLALRKPFERFMKWYVAKVESTKVIA